jgi:ketosteroid isomerase-like protein
MKRMMLLAIFVLCGTAQAFDSPQALQNGFLDAMRAHNVDAMAACYTADATSFGLGVMVGTGPDAVRADWNEFFKSYKLTGVELTDNHRETSGDLSVAWGLFSITATPVGGGEPVVMSGRYTDASKNFDGKWLYVVDHASMPLPPPPPKQ